MTAVVEHLPSKHKALKLDQTPVQKKKTIHCFQPTNEFSSNLKKNVFISLGCCIKVPKTGWFKTTEIVS
jgi:hypothetical protein